MAYATTGFRSAAVSRASAETPRLGKPVSQTIVEERDGARTLFTYFACAPARLQTVPRGQSQRLDQSVPEATLVDPGEFYRAEGPALYPAPPSTYERNLGR